MRSLIVRWSMPLVLAGALLGCAGDAREAAGSGGAGGAGQGGSGAAAVCGNLVVEGDEDCDGEITELKLCSLLGYDAGLLQCNDTCTFNTSACFTCGDGVVYMPAEECDGTDLGGKSCVSLGYTSGVLSCDPGSCYLDTSGCLLNYEICDNGLDDDGDGKADCNDSECETEPFCLPVEFIVNCEQPWCTFTPGAGPNGGDRCSCVLPPVHHPWNNNGQYVGSCPDYGDGRDLIMVYYTAGYSAYSLDTCATPGNSSVVVFDKAVPTGGVEIACSGDATAEPQGCSEISDSGDDGPPLPTALPDSGELFIIIDEFSPGSYWSSMEPRQIDLELIP